MKRFNRRLVHTSVCLAVLAGLSVSANATENFVLRYAPGIGGADMSAPLDPGMYIQAPVFLYHGKINHDTLTPVPMALVNGAFAAYGNATNTVTSKISLDVRAMLPRFTYMSTNQLLGATVGFTALLPLLEQRSNVSVVSNNTALPAAAVSGLTGPQQAGSIAAINAYVAPIAANGAALATDKKWGIGDLEVGAIFRWNRDPDQVVFIPTVVLPTGAYDPTRATNPGAGKFYTVRPTVQYSHIGDGWDASGRVSYSWNTKNKDTSYRSGSYVNIDWALMKSLSDAFRVGVQGYVIEQVTKDTRDAAPTAHTLLDVTEGPTIGNKGRVFAVGPSIAWIKGAGELLVEAKVMKEFAAHDRPEGTALWLSIAKPIQ